MVASPGRGRAHESSRSEKPGSWARQLGDGEAVLQLGPEATGWTRGGLVCGGGFGREGVCVVERAVGAVPEGVDGSGALDEGALIRELGAARREIQAVAGGLRDALAADDVLVAQLPSGDEPTVPREQSGVVGGRPRLEGGR